MEVAGVKPSWRRFHHLRWFPGSFKVKGAPLDFVLINIHTKQDDATTEIEYLPDVFADVFPHINESDIICLGDYNADGSYYDEDTYTNAFPSSEYNWLIGNNKDTTLAANDYTYDRIVTTLSMSVDLSASTGVYLFDQLHDFSSPTLNPGDVSDHYPVSVELYIGKDSD